MRRIMLTELRRGMAPLTFGAVAVVLAVILANEVEGWIGRWADLNGWVRLALIVTGPVSVALAGWSGGREARRRMDELLSSTPRPPVQPVLLAWSSVTVGAAAGMALAWAAAAVLVGRLATSPGGPSWATLAIGFVGLTACTAIGYAVGRLAPARGLGLVVAPLAGLATYVGFGVLSYASSGTTLLVPPTDQLGAGRYLVAWATAAQVVLFAAVAVLAILAAGRRVGWMPIPAVVAAVAAVPLVRADLDDVVVDDPAAREVVCVPDSDPRVCAQLPLAFVLGSFTAVVDEAMRGWDGLRSAPTRVVAVQAVDGLPEPGTVHVPVDSHLRWDGSLSRFAEYGSDLVTMTRSAGLAQLDPEVCGWPDDRSGWGGGELSWEDAEALHMVARLVVGADPYGSARVVESGEPADFAHPLWDRLSGLGRDGQDAWLRRYLDAVEECRLDVLADMAREVDL